MSNKSNRPLISVALLGMKWTTISQVGREGIRFITLLILTKLLSPADFGLVSMVMIVINFTTVFKDLGTSKALIQKQMVSSNFLNSLFTANLIFGTFITLTLVLTAPIIALFFEETEIIPILRLLSLTFFISSFSIVHQTLLEKEVQFHILAKIELTGTSIGAILGIGSALMGYGVYCLVIQSITNVFCTTILLLVKRNWTPKLKLDLSEILTISHFSLNLMGFNILNYFSRNADYLIIGKCLGAEALGFYTLAYRIMIYPLQYISSIISRVMYPIFSKIQSDIDRFRHIYIYLNQSIALITFPLMLGLVSIGDLFVNGILNPEWAPAIPLITILAPVGLLQSITSNVGLIYQVKNRTDWLLKWGILSSIVVVFAFLVGINWGLIGISIAYAGIMIIVIPMAWLVPFRLIKLRLSRFIQVFWAPAVSSICMFIIVTTLKHTLLSSMSQIVSLISLSFFGAVFYFIMIWIIDRKLLTTLLQFVRLKTS